jgi:hypothetical protein
LEQALAVPVPQHRQYAPRQILRNSLYKYMYMCMCMCKHHGYTPIINDLTQKQHHNA